MSAFKTKASVQKEALFCIHLAYADNEVAKFVFIFLLS